MRGPRLDSVEIYCMYICVPETLVRILRSLVHEIFNIFFVNNLVINFVWFEMEHELNNSRYY